MDKEAAGQENLKEQNRSEKAIGVSRERIWEYKLGKRDNETRSDKVLAGGNN